MSFFRFSFFDADGTQAAGQKAQLRTTGKPRFWRGASFFMDEEATASVKAAAPAPTPIFAMSGGGGSSDGTVVRRRRRSIEPRQLTPVYPDAALLAAVLEADELF